MKKIKWKFFSILNLCQKGMIVIIEKANESQVVFLKKDIENVINTFEENFENSISQFVEATNKDYEKYISKIRIEELRETIKDIKSQNIEITDKVDNKYIKDGFGTIVAIYNGIPKVTMNLLLNAIKTHNKIILCAENEFETNLLIVNILKGTLRNSGFSEEIINIVKGYDDIFEYQEYIDKVIYIGNKYDYINLRKKLYVETEYNGYGYISVFYDNDEYIDFVENMKMYSLNNFIDMDIYDGDIDEAIDRMNYLKLNQTVAIFSKKKSNVIKAILNIKSDNIYINKSPLENYKFKISQNSFIRDKHIL